MVPTLTTFPSLTTVVRVGKVVRVGTTCSIVYDFSPLKTELKKIVGVPEPKILLYERELENEPKF